MLYCRPWWQPLPRTDLATARDDMFTENSVRLQSWYTDTPSCRGSAWPFSPLPPATQFTDSQSLRQLAGLKFGDCGNIHVSGSIRGQTQSLVEMFISSSAWVRSYTLCNNNSSHLKIIWHFKRLISNLKLDFSSKKNGFIAIFSNYIIFTSPLLR